MSKRVVEVFELIKYVDGGSRPFEEGCRILNSNHILLCGFCEATKKGDHYFALCLQSSSLTSYPHEINIYIKVAKSTKTVDAHYSCKAGNSGKCKHIVGALLYINGKTKETTEQLACTDLRQQWGEIKQKVNEAYSPEPFHTFCHGAQTKLKSQILKTAQMKREIFKILSEAYVESELSQHVQCYRSSTKNPSHNVNDNVSAKILKELNNKNASQTPKICDLNSVFGINQNNAKNISSKYLDILSNCIWSTYLKEFTIQLVSREQAIFYNNKVAVKIDKTKQIFLSTMTQNNHTWYLERQVRITGSICYNLYTYMKNSHIDDEWRKKLDSTYKSTFKGNSHTMRGKECESKARCAYEKCTNQKVEELGLIILSTTPWFGFSPDGISNGVLVEIKCPKNPNNLEAQGILKELSYIQFVNDVPILKQRHQYYGQVQLGMCLLKLEKCHLVIYEDIHGSCAIVDVLRDEAFISSLILVLSKCYFKHILPWLVNGTKETEKEN